MKLQWTLRFSVCRLWERLKFKAYAIKLTLTSLCYNEFADKYYLGDTCMEPMFWFVDHFTKALGIILVVGVIILLATIVVIAYIIGLPFWLRKSYFMTFIVLVIGHWLLINVVFHYYMAYITLPGYPPEGALVPEAVSICKKCIAPKPPRTHHCSVCNRCVLKMDHHCPWLNNCIGHFNHRHFFMFCMYIWLGVSFVMLFGLPVAMEHFFGEETKITHSSSLTTDSTTDTKNATVVEISFAEHAYHACIVYAGLLCMGVFMAVGALTMWHARLITHGETSIESHINKKETLRLSKEGKIYKNPYNFGPRKNWKLFLGFLHGRTWRHVLLPSTHKPDGNGLTWPTCNNNTYGIKDN